METRPIRQKPPEDKVGQADEERNKGKFNCVSSELRI